MFVEILSVMLLCFLILTIFLYRKVQIQNMELKFQKQSLSSKYGKISEQFMPFLREYPYNRENFRFIGSPIDGIQFEDDRIVFVEFKTGESKLTAKQKEIKKLVDEKRVEFREIRIDKRE
ncbi:MAG TPA: endonuclease [Candidatus Aenigmarchaeota archaeon]|nr:endonuclease [Candidatus Aenigmarchaeota archaeon]